MPHPHVEEILEPGYLDELADHPMADIRQRRDRAGEVETGLSYLRRLVQGRLDIVMAEQARRRTGAPPEDLAQLVERLPEILGDHVHAPGTGRLPTILAPGEFDSRLEARIEVVVPTAAMAHLEDMADADLAAAADGLAELERDISAERHAFHGALDALQAEIVRRYRSGEASVDTLLA